MAAYAALVSLTHIIDNLQLHPCPPISLHIKQVESLTEKICFLLEFVEAYNPHLGYTTEADPLESRIADAAYAAEDVIESHIVDRITNCGEKISSDVLYQALETLIEEMGLIEKVAMEIKGRARVEHQLYRPLDSLRYPSTVQKSSMIGADDVKLQMMDKLTSDCLGIQIIPVVGMGGVGKTTLARIIYQDQLIKDHFDICAWATISQEYNIREIFVEVLRQVNISEVGQESEDELGERLYKHLFGRKYLIIMDDMWDIDAWDRAKKYFPDNKNGSRVVVTTRLSNLASELPGSSSLEMELLDEAASRDLLSKTVFGEKGCPLELVMIGKKIARSCKGLPLSIVVVGGLLAKSKHTRQFWQYIEENLNAIVNLEDDERCLKILHLSYKELPVHLKPCFLYMGAFSENAVIRASRLVKLWVAEGFLKPMSGKSFEEIAKEYLKDLIGRNLILIHEMGSTGSIKSCRIHDLLRDLCLRQAQKERFHTASPHRIVNGKRRVVTSSRKFLEGMHRFVNSRCLAFSVGEGFLFPSSIWLFWNLQTLIMPHVKWLTLLTDIWHMPCIRHVQFEQLHLPDPPSAQEDIVSRNLQTLVGILNFKCSQRVIKRIPNIKKLQIANVGLDHDKHRLSNLDRLDKLESLRCNLHGEVNPINFPRSLVKLFLYIEESQYWDDMLDKVGTLPHLQKLTLSNGSFREGQWETSQGHFSSLKCLTLYECLALEVWTAESSHFPRLEKLDLCDVVNLKEIPLGFAEIPTLRAIRLINCRNSVAVSVERILKEQEELYGEAVLDVHTR
ncbi:putative late blight resistance protein R1A-10 isoform X1 [Salvia divinorum]|uniref:Late blight resistance protein R1A-10 isoform X1 n=1 Tax=Salvia divinorum TaxID=28513 RepID=A0ABD1H5Q1_SALDI